MYIYISYVMCRKEAWTQVHGCHLGMTQMMTKDIKQPVALWTTVALNPGLARGPQGGLVWERSSWPPEGRFRSATWHDTEDDPASALWTTVALNPGLAGGPQGVLVWERSSWPPKGRFRGAQPVALWTNVALHPGLARGYPYSAGMGNEFMTRKH